jgi:tRNA (guanine37-N1)-methyltransferase
MTVGIFVPARKTQTTLELLRKMRLKLDEFQLNESSGVIGIPLIHAPSSQEESVLTKELGEFQIHEALFRPISSRPKNLHEALRGAVPPELASQLPRSFDVIGDIAIIELPSELASYSVAVGNGVLQANSHVRLVMKKSGDVNGTFRTRPLQPLVGSGGTETVHHEFGCRYHLDVSSVYFNPRLAHERLRVAKQVMRDEVVVDMFAGVGPYSILIAKLQPKSRVYSVDINPSAIRYLKENALTNDVADHVIPLLGDARELSRSELRNVGDRVIMNLPSEALDYLDAAVQILKDGRGVIHFYEFAQRGANLNSVKEQFQAAIEARQRTVKSHNYVKVIREIAPNRIQVAVDAAIQ